LGGDERQPAGGTDPERFDGRDHRQADGPQVGQINFTVTVTDSENPAKTANANLSITISAPPLSVTTLTLPGGTLGTAYNQTLGATGGITPYAWSISVGALPAGLT